MSEEYVALTKVHLHLFDGENHRSDGGVYKNPGDQISAEELEAAGQGEEEIQNLLDGHAIIPLGEYQAGVTPMDVPQGDSVASTSESATVEVKP